MGSLDIHSHERKFTTTTLEKIIKICTNNLFKDNDIGSKKSESKDLLSYPTKEFILYLTMYYTKKLAWGPH